MEDSRIKNIIHLLIGLLIFLIVPFVQPSVNLYGSSLIPIIISQLGIFHQQETLANMTYNITYLKITSITQGTIVSDFAYSFLNLYSIFEYIILALTYMYILDIHIFRAIYRKKEN